MHRIYSGFARRSPACVVLLLITVFVTAGTAQAGSTWLEKGANLLKTFTGVAPRGDITVEEIGAGLKDALRVGSDRVVARLGSVDGFNTDPSVHIPLPRQLGTVKSALGKIGLSGSLDDLEVKLNRAAEAATPKARKLFREAIAAMTFDDAKAIYKGPENAATRYFREKMSPSLAREMRPIVRGTLATVGAVQAYEDVMKKYRVIPLVPEVKADLTGYVVEKGMDGIFHYMAKEEAAIRRDPARRTTEILRRVFGAQ